MQDSIRCENGVKLNSLQIPASQSIHPGIFIINFLLVFDVLDETGR
jgi:hypothetical protein